jgi:hypothetical protein
MHAADRVRCVRDDVAAISVAIEAALENFPEAKLAVAEAMKRLASASPES